MGVAESFFKLLVSNLAWMYIYPVFRFLIFHGFFLFRDPLMDRSKATQNYLTRVLETKKMNTVKLFVGAAAVTTTVMNSGSVVMYVRGGITGSV